MHWTFVSQEQELALYIYYNEELPQKDITKVIFTTYQLYVFENHCSLYDFGETDFEEILQNAQCIPLLQFNRGRKLLECFNTCCTCDVESQASEQFKC